MNVLAANKIFPLVMDGGSLFHAVLLGRAGGRGGHAARGMSIRIEVVAAARRRTLGSVRRHASFKVFHQTGVGHARLSGGAQRRARRIRAFGVDLRRLGSASRRNFRTYAEILPDGLERICDRGPRGSRATDFLQTGFRIDSRRFVPATIANPAGDYYTNADLPLDRVQSEGHGGR